MKGNRLRENMIQLKDTYELKFIHTSCTALEY